MKKDTIKIILLLILLGGIIFATIKINNTDIKPLITLNDKQKKKENKKEEKKEDNKKEESKKTVEKEPEPEPEPEPIQPKQSLYPNNAEGQKVIQCSISDKMESGTDYTIQYFAYFDRIGGTMNKALIYSEITVSDLTEEEKNETAKALESELKKDYPSFNSKSQVMDNNIQVLLEGTPDNLITDYKILSQESLEYYNFAPTLRYEGFTCTIN